MNEFERAKASHEEKMQKGYKQSKTADEMFEDMKYVIVVNNEELIMYSSVKRNIIFNLIDKEVTNSGLMLYVGELKAIHQKALELGWLDE